MMDMEVMTKRTMKKEILADSVDSRGGAGIGSGSPAREVWV